MQTEMQTIIDKRELIAKTKETIKNAMPPGLGHFVVLMDKGTKQMAFLCETDDNELAEALAAIMQDNAGFYRAISNSIIEYLNRQLKPNELPKNDSNEATTD